MRTCAIALAGISAMRTTLILSGLLYLGAEGVCRSTPLNDAEQLVLDAHNSLRALHLDTPPLCYAESSGEDVTFAAQKWADHLADTDTFDHTPNPKKFGENMAWSSFTQDEPDPGKLYLDAADRWYSEIKDWDFALGKSNGLTSHFTQVVWKSSKQLNCGFKTYQPPEKSWKKAVVVCQYWPRGNWIRASEYPTEVHKLKGSLDENGGESNPKEDSENKSEEESEDESLDKSEDKSEEESGDKSEDKSEEEPEVDSNEVSNVETENTSERDSDSNIIEGPENLVIKPSNDFSTCDCWTPECGYCRDVECTVKQDLVNSEQGIAVSSVVKRKQLNSIVFYEEGGDQIGMFQWNRRGIYLTGCIACYTPRALKGKCLRHVQTLWVVSITNGILRIKIDGEVLYEHELRGDCLERYSKAKRFAFYGTPDDDSFSFLPEEMEAGEKIVNTGCV